MEKRRQVGLPFDEFALSLPEVMPLAVLIVCDRASDKTEIAQDSVNSFLVSNANL